VQIWLHLRVLVVGKRGKDGIALEFIGAHTALLSREALVEGYPPVG
jgi:hypothetical protein